MSMMYAPGPVHQRSSFRWGGAITTGLVVVALFIVFVFAVRWFRAAPREDSAVVSSIADVLKPDPIAQAVIENGIDTESRVGTLVWQATGESVGQMRRGEKDGVYYVELEATLPEIDREKNYYQVWLLRTLPYDFFSLGEMVTNDDGAFVLEWSAPDGKDYTAYTDVVVTVNAYEGSTDPGEHLVEGTFGN